MGIAVIRRKALLLALTHVLAFALPIVLGVVAIHYLRPSVARVNASLAQSYSRHVAGFDVAAGDSRAARAGLGRHLDRVTAIRRQLVSDGTRGDDLLLADCDVFAEIAYLSDEAEREAVSEEFRKACPYLCQKRGLECVLAIGASRVNLERGAE